MNKQELLSYLDELGTEYELIEHKPVFTVEEAIALNLPHPEAGAKNLFLRDKKKHHYYLVAMRDGLNRTFKELQERIGSTALSFASEEDLMAILGLIRGSVTPFGVMNDTEKKVHVYIDSYFSGKIMSVHPNENNATMFLLADTLLDILRANGSKAEFLDL